MLTEGVTKEFKEKGVRIPAKEDCGGWLTYEERR